MTKLLTLLTITLLSTSVMADTAEVLDLLTQLEQRVEEYHRSTLTLKDVADQLTAKVGE